MCVIGDHQDVIDIGDKVQCINSRRIKSKINLETQIIRCHQITGSHIRIIYELILRSLSLIEQKRLNEGKRYTKGI